MEDRYPMRIDSSIIRMFLSMTPEDRIQANDNASQALLELRHAVQKREETHRLKNH